MAEILTMDSPRDEMAPEHPAFSFREARKLIGDLFVHNSFIYWTDMLLTGAVGYGCATCFLKTPGVTWLSAAAYLIAGFALFRVGSYIHEITHMRTGEMLKFRIAWNVLFGIPLLMPSFFYENHIDHHNSRHYGTVHDGEYLPIGAGRWGQLVLFWMQVPLLPVYIFLRFLIGTPLSFCYPPLRKWLLEHMSSFVINFKHRLTIPNNAPLKTWAWLEFACFLRCFALSVAVCVGFREPAYVFKMYCIAVLTLGLNYIRNMAAHHYRNDGEAMSHLEQLEDSVNIEGMPVVTELFFPLHLRYHALHHLFPSLPYHNLAKAHRRLMAGLPENSIYHRTVYKSFWSVVSELWRDATSEPKAANNRASAA